MTVKELIQKLQNFDENTEVLIHSSYCEYEEITSIQADMLNVTDSEKKEYIIIDSDII